jgi:hypothetical protein
MTDSSDPSAPASEDEREAAVETHKPKSWHGPGEFFRECLIIVVGAALDRCRSAMIEKYEDWARGAPQPETPPASLSAGAFLMTTFTALCLLLDIIAATILVVFDLSDICRSG